MWFGVTRAFTTSQDFVYEIFLKADIKDNFLSKIASAYIVLPLISTVCNEENVCVAILGISPKALSYWLQISVYKHIKMYVCKLPLIFNGNNFYFNGGD